MIRVQRSALVASRVETLYALVADIEAYPQFLPWCRGAKIHERRDEYVRATLRIDFRGVRQEFTTENTHQVDARIEMRLIDGPFKSLVGCWKFQPLGPNACKVEFELAYEFASALLGRLVGPVFNHIANTLVDAFIRRSEATASATAKGAADGASR